MTSQSRVMERPEISVAALGAAMVGLGETFVASKAPKVEVQRPSVAGVATTATGAATGAVTAPNATSSTWGWGLATAGLLAARAGRSRRARRSRRAGPELTEVLNQSVGNADFLQQVQEFCRHANLGDHANLAEVAATLQQWADGLSQTAGHLAREVVPPAYAADLPPVELDPNTTYLYGADGAVLVDPMNNKPIPDDWWNGFIGFQKDIIKSIDNILRENGREPRSLKPSFGRHDHRLKKPFFRSVLERRATPSDTILNPKVTISIYFNYNLEKCLTNISGHLRSIFPKKSFLYNMSIYAEVSSKPLVGPSCCTRPSSSSCSSH